MTCSALVIGYGSIGKRHANILNEMNEINNVSVLSNQRDLPFDTITSLEKIPNLKPDYVIIASNTSLHFEQLCFLNKILMEKKILVEKPLFDRFQDFVIKNNQVFVGYNLRFHPIMKKIKEKISGRNLWNINLLCGSYLPDWRPGRDYRETYSAKRDTGGGVLLDLSHELDYLLWLAGPIEVKYAVHEKVSDLEIETDDMLFFAGESESGTHVTISLNYFSRHPIRQILIEGEGISIKGDLIANSLSFVEDKETLELNWPELKRNYTYLEQHRAIIIENSQSFVCTYTEGLETMRLIENIRSINN